MRRIQDLVSRELEWTQPSAFKRDFVLKHVAELVATLRFRSLFGSYATAQTADGAWTFKRVGFWQTRATICPVGSESEIAAFRNNTWSAGGILELTGGRSLRANTNFWMSKYEFSDETGKPLVLFHRFGGPLHLSCRIEIRPEGAALPELPWLVAFGWYLAVKMQDDGAGGAAAAAGG